MIKKSVFIIGLGRMGMAHAAAVRELGWFISGVSDTNSECAALACKQLGLDQSCQFQNYKELFGSDLFADVVIIATTANAHADIVVDAANRGIPYILCEKPMATSLSDCVRMLDSCKKSGSLLAVNHPMRFMPRYTMVKECFESNPFGELVSMNVVGGAFGMAMNGSHYIEACSFLTGAKPCEVTAWLSTDLKNPRGEQFCSWSGQARIVYESGKRLMIDADSRQGHGMTATYATKNGYLFVDELAGKVHGMVRQDEFLQQPTTRYGLPSRCVQASFNPFDNVECSRSVLKALVAGSDYPSGDVGFQVVKVLVAMFYSSSNFCRPVKIDEVDLPFEKRFAWA